MHFQAQETLQTQTILNSRFQDNVDCSEIVRSLCKSKTDELTTLISHSEWLISKHYE